MSSTTPPQIRKAAQIVGNTLSFRNATVDDAAFILSLRTDTEKSRYLSAVSGQLQDQIGWLGRYARANDEAYFIIEFRDQPVGTVRLYDARDSSF